MIKTRQPETTVEVVGWLGEESKPYRVIRLEELTGKSPRDGHDPGSPHRIGFHAMMLVTQGRFRHWLDFETHSLSEHQLIYIAPNQVHHFVEHSQQSKVWALIFRPEVLPGGLLQLDDECPPWSVMCHLWPSITKLDPEEAGLLDQQLSILQRLDAIGSERGGNAANHHVCGIIALAFELAKKSQREPKDLVSNPRFFEFVQLVEQSFTSRRDVKWYAEQMECSQRTLNRDCQNVTGKSAKAVLSERVIIEAKRFLTYGADSVNAVAAKLGFGATTNFVRYFRNETGMTPQEFRNSQGTK